MARLAGFSCGPGATRVRSTLRTRIGRAGKAGNFPLAAVFALPRLVPYRGKPPGFGCGKVSKGTVGSGADDSGGRSHLAGWWGRGTRGLPHPADADVWHHVFSGASAAAAAA